MEAWLFSVFLAPAFVPFTFALILLLALLGLELILMLVVRSLLGDSVDLDSDFDFGAELDADLALGLDGGLSVDAGSPLAADAGRGALSWLGLGKTPF